MTCFQELVISYHHFSNYFLVSIWSSTVCRWRRFAAVKRKNSAFLKSGWWAEMMASPQLVFAQASHCCRRGGVWLRPHRQRGWRWGAGQQVIVNAAAKSKMNSEVWYGTEMNRIWITCQQRKERERERVRKSKRRVKIDSFGRQRFWTVLKCDPQGAGSCQLPHWDYMRVTDGLLGREGRYTSLEIPEFQGNDLNDFYNQQWWATLCVLCTPWAYVDGRWGQPKKQLWASEREVESYLILCYFFLLFPGRI